QEKGIQEQNNMLTKEIKEKEKAVAQEAAAQWDQPNYRVDTSFLLQDPLPVLNMGGNYREGAQELGRNELDLTLEPQYYYNS
ncbi:agamous-like MADS-box protein AP1, partial [Cicer arietinum]|uniref:Floral homeotic protein APETALA 1-like n=1 Tax=Cicer arietinum TaxID=3827 RepID=A0A3Q7X292_CICAR